MATEKTEKKNKVVKASTKKDTKVAVSETGSIYKKSAASALLRPLITEKSATASASNIYTFEVPASFNKIEIKNAIESLYNVKPIAVNIVIVAPKAVMYRGKPGKKSGYKKAMVQLAEGDKIEFV